VPRSHREPSGADGKPWEAGSWFKSVKQTDAIQKLDRSDQVDAWAGGRRRVETSANIVLTIMERRYDRRHCSIHHLGLLRQTLMNLLSPGKVSPAELSRAKFSLNLRCARSISFTARS